MAARGNTHAEGVDSAGWDLARTKGCRTPSFRVGRVLPRDAPPLLRTDTRWRTPKWVCGAGAFPIDAPALENEHWRSALSTGDP